MEVKVIKPGMLTTVQDLGRRGHRADGLAPGGAADGFALRLANLLVGNEPDAAGLEMTLTGAELEFGAEALVAVAGADMGGLEPLRPHAVKAGGRLRFGAARTGCRAYLAVAGGFEVPPVLGGRGTDLRAGIGGHKGRALRAGDVLRVNVVPHQVVGHWQADPRLLPAYGAAALRVLPGAQAEEFGEDFLTTTYQVSPQSDRMGIRLRGPGLIRRSDEELVSAAVAPGTVQVPPDGSPIILLADAQTIGGYPRLAHVIQPDWPLLAQLRPSDPVRFETVDLATAHRVARERERALGLLHEGLRQKLR